MEEKALILLRGLPGSGKTSLARLLSEEGKYKVHSIDSYFTDAESGEYSFRYRENHLAYKQCEALTRASLEKKELKVFVDNTFTLEWEIEPYVRMASEFGYKLFVVTVEKRHDGKNSHGVTDEQIEKMASKYKVILS